jgi:hypothetical protein
VVKRVRFIIMTISVLAATSCKDPAAMTQQQDVVRRALVDAGVDIPEFRVQHAAPDGTVLRFDVEARQAIDIWERVRPVVEMLGYYPVVCHDEHGNLVEQPVMNEGLPSDVMSVAAKADASSWFQEREAGAPDYYGNVDQGEWQDREPQSNFTVPFDVSTGEPVDGVWIALVPTTAPWEVLAYLDYGDWNECPAPAEHVAVQKHWHERYGAEIVCASGDVVEMRVTRPPTSQAAAMELAREQFLYSGGDLVFQGVETMSALGAALVGSSVWYFWWD